jgi:hypothetical protein
MEVVDNTVLKFSCPVDIADMINRHIDKSQVVREYCGVADMIMYWGIDEAQRLAQIAPPSIKIPSPIERDYQWPGMLKPFDHQRDTARFLTLHRRAFCFNEAGTGKTSAAIWAADYLLNLGLIKRVLVICPLSIMQSASSTLTA